VKMIKTAILKWLGHVAKKENNVLGKYRQATKKLKFIFKICYFYQIRHTLNYYSA
jgi:hypothetical protein